MKGSLQIARRRTFFVTMNVVATFFVLSARAGGISGGGNGNYSPVKSLPAAELEKIAHQMLALMPFVFYRMEFGTLAESSEPNPGDLKARSASAYRKLFRPDAGKPDIHQILPQVKLDIRTDRLCEGPTGELSDGAARSLSDPVCLSFFSPAEANEQNRRRKVRLDRFNSRKLIAGLIAHEVSHLVGVTDEGESEEIPASEAQIVQDIVEDQVSGLVLRNLYSVLEKTYIDLLAVRDTLKPLTEFPADGQKLNGRGLDGLMKQVYAMMHGQLRPASAGLSFFKPQQLCRIAGLSSQLESFEQYQGGKGTEALYLRRFGGKESLSVSEYGFGEGADVNCADYEIKDPVYKIERGDDVALKKQLQVMLAVFEDLLAEIERLDRRIENL